MRPILIVTILTATLAAPAAAQNYPVSGKWGQSAGSAEGAIDCGGKRVIEFNGNQRTDSKGGVPAYRNKSVTDLGQSRYRVVDQFTNGQVSGGSTAYTLQRIDDDHIELNLQPGGSLKLQRCR